MHIQDFTCLEYLIDIKQSILVYNHIHSIVILTPVMQVIDIFFDHFSSQGNIVIADVNNFIRVSYIVLSLSKVSWKV